jgi:hypothetical protein
VKRVVDDSRVCVVLEQDHAYPTAASADGGEVGVRGGAGSRELSLRFENACLL